MPHSSTITPRRRRLAAVGVCLLVLALATLCGCGGRHGEQSTVVARVNGHAILRSALDVARASARLSGRVPSDAQLLRLLIDRELVREEALRLGVTVSPAAVDARLAAVTKEAGGAAALAADLKSAGLDEAALRDAVQQVLLSESLQDRKFGAIRASRAQSLAYFRRHRALFRRAPSVELADIVVRNQASAAIVLRRLKQGQPFAAAAQQFSRDRESAVSGGVMGWVLVASLPRPLAAVAAKLAAGAMSAPVNAPGGVYILKLLGRREGRQFSFAHVASEISHELTSRRRSASLAAWVRQSRAQADVEIIK
jgi:peptidyl-prolyl cis-trans isomerase SurA